MNNWNIKKIIIFTTGIFIATFIAGCSGSSSNDKTPDYMRGTATIYGRAVLDSYPIADASVSIVSANGYVLGKGTTDHGGAFQAKMTHLPTGAYSVNVTASDGLVFSNEIDKLDDRFIHVNAMTTIRKAFRARHPEITIADARTIVHRYFGITPGHDLGDEVAQKAYSGFSSSEFVREALKHSGKLKGYVEDAVTAIPTALPLPGATESEGPDEWIMIIKESDPGKPLPQPDIDLQQDWNERQLQKMIDNQMASTHLPEAKVSEEVAAEIDDEFSIGASIGDAIIDNIVGIGFDLIPGIGKGWALNQIASQLGMIEGQLSILIDMITNLEAVETVQFNETDYLTISNQMNPAPANITAANNIVQAIVQYSNPNQPDPTNTDEKIQDLLTGYTMDNMINYADTIQSVQFSGSPQTHPLIAYAKTLNNADKYISNTTLSGFYNQIYYYVTLQSQAMGVINSLSSPAYVTQTGHYNFVSTPAGSKNDAGQYAYQITSNIQQQMSYKPYQLLDANQILDISDKRVFQAASYLGSTGGSSSNYVDALTSGGLEVWSVASPSEIKNLFNTVPGSKPSSYSSSLNSMGFNLKPGSVTYSRQVNNRYGKWVNGGSFTATSNGFLTYSQSGSTWTIGWVDDKGNTGTIGTYKGSNSISSVLDSSRDVYQGAADTMGDVNYAGHINGPVIIVASPYNAFEYYNQQASAAPIAFGYYNGINITSGTPQANQGGKTYTQQFSAFPVPESSYTSYVANYDITQSVFWEILDQAGNPTSDTTVFISNAPVADEPQPAGPQTYTAPPSTIGIVTWMSGSAGKTFKIRASRYNPDGTIQTGITQTVTSPVSGSAVLEPLGVSVWPTKWFVDNSEFHSTGVRIWSSIYLGDGSFLDGATNSLFPVTYSAADNRLTIEDDGLIKSKTILPAGTPLVITASRADATIENEAVSIIQTMCDSPASLALSPVTYTGTADYYRESCSFPVYVGGYRNTVSVSGMSATIDSSGNTCTGIPVQECSSCGFTLNVGQVGTGVVTVTDGITSDHITVTCNPTMSLPNGSWYYTTGFSTGTINIPINNPRGAVSITNLPSDWGFDQGTCTGLKNSCSVNLTVPVGESNNSLNITDGQTIRTIGVSCTKTPMSLDPTSAVGGWIRGQLPHNCIFNITANSVSGPLSLSGIAGSISDSTCTGPFPMASCGFTLTVNAWANGTAIINDTSSNANINCECTEHEPY